MSCTSQPQLATPYIWRQIGQIVVAEVELAEAIGDLGTLIGKFVNLVATQREFFEIIN